MDETSANIQRLAHELRRLQPESLDDPAGLTEFVKKRARIVDSLNALIAHNPISQEDGDAIRSALRGSEDLIRRLMQRRQRLLDERTAARRQRQALRRSNAFVRQG